MIPGYDIRQFANDTTYTIHAAGDGPHEMGASLRTNIKRYQLYLDLYRGGEYVTGMREGRLHPKTGEFTEYGSYLSRLPAEKEKPDGVDPFYERVRRAFHVPYCQRIINTYVQTFARQPVDRGPVRLLVGSVMDDLDGKGTGHAQFIQHLWAHALACGWTTAYIAMVDGRPICRQLLPTRIYRYTTDYMSGRLTSIIIRESEDLYRYWDSERWVSYDKTGQKISSGDHQYGRVPVVVLTAFELDDTDRSDAPLGRSAISDAADMEIEALNTWSLHAKTQEKGNYMFLHVHQDPILSGDRGNKAGMSRKTLGEEFMLYADADVNWVSPSREVMEETREYLRHLESEILKAGGVHRRDQDSIEAHSGLSIAWEMEPRNDYIRYLSGRLYTFELEFWRYIAELTGVDIGDARPIYPEEFTTAPTDVLLRRARDVIGLYGSYSDTPEQSRMFVDDLMRQVITREIGCTKSGQEILALRGEVETEDTSVSIPDLLSAIDQLMKIKAPQELVREIIRIIATRLGITDTNVLNTINTNDFAKFVPPFMDVPVEADSEDSTDSEDNQTVKQRSQP